MSLPDMVICEPCRCGDLSRPRVVQPVQACCNSKQSSPTAKQSIPTAKQIQDGGSCLGVEGSCMDVEASQLGPSNKDHGAMHMHLLLGWTLLLFTSDSFFCRALRRAMSL